MEKSPKFVLCVQSIVFFFNRNAGCPEANDQPTGCNGRCEPIDYFVQYFSWSLWKDIAACTQQVSKSAKPVTEKEVAQFVGIHIAMGTLKVSKNIHSWPKNIDKVIVILGVK